LEAQVNKSDGVSLRRVDIASWDSAVARKYKIRSIPHLMIFERGKLIAEGGPELISQID
jgi:thioredoxin-like negative regulator of GroEL